MGADKKGLVVLVVLGAVFVAVYRRGPIPQDTAYHDFADQAALAGIPNALNVVSNVPFFFAGLYGMYVLRCARLPGTFADSRHTMAYWLVFVASCLVSFGSAYYHLWPSNDTLFFDRLPMTVAFASLTTILLTEKVHSGWGPRTLLPLTGLGLLSVCWWAFTESHPDWVGDLRLYVVVQSAPVLLTPLLGLLYTSRFSHAGYLHATTALYVVAKFAEMYDRELYELTGRLLSGHSIKHLLAAVGPVLIARMVQLRKPLRPYSE